MIVYADTSALAKLLLAETGSAEVLATVQSAVAVASAAIGYVELRAALASAIRDRRVNATDRDRLMLALERLWDSVTEIVLDHTLLRDAGELAERLHLRGYDALHLAALRQLGGPAEITFACWDEPLRRAASGLGYRLIPV